MPAERQFSPAEIAHMKLAGIPADRPDLGGNYPRMMYKVDKLGDPDHNLASDAVGGVSRLGIQGRKDIATLIVNDEAEEIVAAVDGWATSIALALVEAEPIPEPVVARGPGRPPKAA